MKRSGFKPKCERRPEKRMDDYTVKPRAPACAISDGKARLTVAVPKRAYVRSQALIKACRELACQHCGAAGPDAGVCAAHSNWSVHGKGGHIKADDSRVAALCKDCHVPTLDQGSHLTKAERQAMWWAAHVRTVVQMVARGLWPAQVPLPDTERNSFSE